MKTGVLEASRGSAFIEMGNTKLMCSMCVFLCVDGCSSLSVLLLLLTSTVLYMCCCHVVTSFESTNSVGPRPIARAEFSEQGLLQCFVHVAPFAMARRCSSQSVRMQHVCPFLAVVVAVIIVVVFVVVFSVVFRAHFLWLIRRSMMQKSWIASCPCKCLKRWKDAFASTSFPSR